MRYYIIAGEASGDLHGAALMKGLYENDPSCEVRFWGGDAMAAVGGTMVRHYRDTAVMGVVEVLSKAGRIVGNISCCKQDMLTYSPDVVILVDYPGFNLKMAKFAKSHGFRVSYFIAPKVWARGEGRVSQLKRYVDRLYIIFPFEKDWFAERGIDAVYFGNPLLDAVEFHDFKPVGGGGKTIALLAGSRAAELKFMMPRFVALEKLLRADPRLEGYSLLIAGAPSLTAEDYARHIPTGSSLKVVFGRTYDILRQADAAVVCSGTASLEAALIGTPQVVCYGFNKLTYAIAKRLVRVKYISLANLILDRLVFKELIQDEASADNIAQELQRLILDAEYASQMKENYKKIKDMTGDSGASNKIARDIYETTLLQVSGCRQ